MTIPICFTAVIIIIYFLEQFKFHGKIEGKYRHYHESLVLTLS